MSQNSLLLLSHPIPKPFKNVKIILGLLAIQKSRADWIWLVVHLGSEQGGPLRTETL